MKEKEDRRETGKEREGYKGKIRHVKIIYCSCNRHGNAAKKLKSEVTKLVQDDFSVVNYIKNIFEIRQNLQMYFIMRYEVTEKYFVPQRLNGYLSEEYLKMLPILRRVTHFTFQESQIC